MARLIDPTEILLRNRSALAAERPLLIDPPNLGAAAYLSTELGWPETHVLVRDYRLFRAWDKASEELRVSFGMIEADPARHDLALVLMPRGKRLLRMTISWLASVMPVDSRIVVAGGKRSGVISASQMMEPTMARVRRLDSARHCVLVCGVLTENRPGFDLEQWSEIYELPVDDRQLKVASLPGVFSDGELDAGTARLLRHFEPGGPKRVLDVGCGQGAIGATVAASLPRSEVIMTDVHAAAVESAKRTVELNDLGNCTVVAADLYDETSGQFDLIVSNPPFHQGDETESSTVEAMISGATDHLSTSGSLQLVANRFLPYQRELTRYFRKVSILYEDNRFRVWKASGARTEDDARSGT